MQDNKKNYVTYAILNRQTGFYEEPMSEGKVIIFEDADTARNFAKSSTTGLILIIDKTRQYLLNKEKFEVLK